MAVQKSVSKKLKSAAGIALLCSATSAMAIPELQLYIEGATYDTTTDTWIASGSGDLRLWTIGNVAGAGSKGSIFDVKLSIAYADGLTPTFSLTSSTTGGFGGYTDPSTPVAATFSKTVTDGSAPILGDGTSLPTHGIYGSATDWTEFLLGDFTLTDSQIGDFITSFPAASGALVGQINVYDISITGVAAGTAFHFDLYDHYLAANDAKYINAPFSHDAGGTSSTSSGGGGASTSGPIPEPGTLTLMGAAILGGLFQYRRRSQPRV